MEGLWPDTFVEGTNLTFNISVLSKALGESPRERVSLRAMPGQLDTPGQSNWTSLPPANFLALNILGRALAVQR
jgi:hypothetical protein